jgi:hypothetical protein
MKRLLLVLATSAALSAWGQAGQETQKTAKGAGANSDRPATVIIQGADGRTHELQVPVTKGQMQGLLAQAADAADLENMIGSQAGCPVQILNASFDRPAQLMLTSHSQADNAPSLHLEYRNSSGKDIQSVLLTGWIKVKDNPYQLDSVSHPFQLELSRSALLGKDVQAAQVLNLVGNAIGFDRIELTQVTFADGTTSTPERRSCVYANMGATERAKAW